MNIENKNIPQEVASDEKLLAMLSHLSIFLGGILLPIIIWATQKDKSRFVRFHSLQSIFYHIVFAIIIMLYVLVMALIFIFTGVGLGVFGKGHAGRNDAPPAIFFVAIILFYGGLFLFIFSGIGYAIYLAVKSYKGYIVRIPVIGNIIYKKVYGNT